MTWQDRLKKSIKLTSPDGNVFEILWTGNPRMLSKKLGIFEYPKIRGTVIQDLDVSGTRYPLTLLFEGPDNDIEADRFFRACSENGMWTVEHPVRGTLILHLSTASEAIQPVTSGNLTVIETEWIEALESTVRTGRSTLQIASAISDQAEAVHETSFQQFEQAVKQTSATETLAVKSTVGQVTDGLESNLSILYEDIPELNARMTSTLAGIQNTIDQSTIDVLALAGQMQTLVTLPVMAIRDVRRRLSLYDNLIADIIELNPSGITPEDRNIAAVQELALTACLVAQAEISISGDLDTRNQAIEATETVSDAFMAITDGLDATQEAFISQAIDLQYFSQSASFSDASVIVSLAMTFLLMSAFDLATEKRFILKTSRAPIEIAITEYGTLGLGDMNFDLLIASNNLKDQDILILPAGQEVVVYV